MKSENRLALLRHVGEMKKLNLPVARVRPPGVARGAQQQLFSNAWNCASCGTRNDAERERCVKCRCTRRKWNGARETRF